MVEKPFEIGIDDLLAKMPLEERVYRHRCVETWSMVVPWSGFPLKSLVEFCKPAGGAKYVVMQTLHKPAVMPGPEGFLYPWPYTEGLAMDEAMNDLSFIATGLYGKPIPKQNGAPIRLVAPWKYGFKNVKSIVSIEFSDKRPVVVLGEAEAERIRLLGQREPEVPHPRWSQATEKPLGSERARADPALQRLCRVRCRALRRPQGGKALHVSAALLCLAAPAPLQRAPAS